MNAGTTALVWRGYVSVLAVASAVLTLVLAGPAFAFQCPLDLAKIDAALESANQSEEVRVQVVELRDQGEAFHNAGQHQEAVDTLAQAMELLGIN